MTADLASAALTAERLRLAETSAVLRYALLYHRTDRGDPLTFAGREWLLALYEMWGSEPPRRLRVSMMKATQVGISEELVVLCWAWAGELGARILYVLPRTEDRQAFYSARLKKPIEHVARYRALTRRTRTDALSVYLMSIGRGSLSLAGSNSTASFTSKPADVVIVDELDECNQANLEMAEERTSHADSWKILIDVANPTVSDFGISARFEAGCRYRWHVECSACGVLAPLDWFAHFVEKTKEGLYRLRDRERARRPNGPEPRAVCASCGEPFDRLGAGEWKADEPENPIRTFHISKLHDSGKTVWELWRRFERGLSNADAMRRFWNSDLGLPFAAEGSKLDRVLIRSRRYRYRKLERNLWEPVRTMGIDVGSPHKVVVSDLCDPDKYGLVPKASSSEDLEDQRRRRRERPVRRLIHVAEPRSLREIDDLVRRFRPRAICIDARPEVEAVIEARKRWGRILGSKRRIWRVEYLADRVDDAQTDPRSGIAKVDRTLLLDRSVSDWVDGFRVVPQDVEGLAGGRYVSELCVPTRVQEEGPRKIAVFRWTKGVDHFFHADGYDRLASEMVRRGAVSGGLAEWLPGL